MDPSQQHDESPDDRPNIGQQNIERLLAQAYRPEEPDPRFAEGVRSAVEAAARVRRERALAARTTSVEARQRRDRVVALAGWGTAAALLIAIFALRAREERGTGNTPPSGVAVHPSTAAMHERLSPTDTELAAKVRREREQIAQMARAIGEAHTESQRGAGQAPLFSPADSPSWRMAHPLPPAPPAIAAASGQALVTGPRQRRRMTLSDGSVLYLNENGKVRLLGDRRLALDSGEIFLEVAPRKAAAGLPAAAPFVVQTPSRELTALGTKFAVSAASGSTDLVVVQGAVRLSGIAAPVEAGQQVRLRGADQKQSPRAEAAPRLADFLDWTRDLFAAAEPQLVPASAYAGGAITIQCADGRQQALSLRRYHVDVYIEDGFARTTIDQTYFNHLASRQEGTFHFPLPPDASISRLAMYVGGKLTEGGMVERSRGRDVYESIVYRMQDPALLEWIDGTTFQMRVYPLEPRQEKRIILSYTQRLETLHGQLCYRFPAGHRLGEAGQESLNARVRGGAGCAWQSATHELTAVRDGRDLLLKAAGNGFRLDRDLQLQWAQSAANAADADDDTNAADADDAAAAGKSAPAAVRFSTDTQEGWQYLMLRYTPQLPATIRPERRDWIFLVETAADRTPVVARAQVEIVRGLLNCAGHDDTFAMISAGSHPRVITDVPQRVTAGNIAATCDRLARAHLVGALDLESALAAASTLSSTAQHPVIVHLGSGVPVLGQRSDSRLAALISKRAQYVGVAVGRTWNRLFMKQAASRHHGYVTQINPGEPLAWRAMELLSTLNVPRLLEVKVCDAHMDSPWLLYDDAIAHGETICAITRRPVGEARPKGATVSGQVDGAAWQREIPLHEESDGAGYLPRQWARLEIDRLLTDSGAANHDQIVSLSKSMCVMSPYTSLLVLENDAMYKQYGVDRGRQDPWARYPAPASIPVVTEPLENARQKPTNELLRHVPGTTPDTKQRARKRVELATEIMRLDIRDELARIRDLLPTNSKAARENLRTLLDSVRGSQDIAPEFKARWVGRLNDLLRDPRHIAAVVAAEKRSVDDVLSSVLIPNPVREGTGPLYRSAQELQNRTDGGEDSLSRSYEAMAAKVRRERDLLYQMAREVGTADTEAARAQQHLLADSKDQLSHDMEITNQLGALVGANWLARHQRSAGQWNLHDVAQDMSELGVSTEAWDHHNRPEAATALGLLALLGTGTQQGVAGPLSQSTASAGTSVAPALGYGHLLGALGLSEVQRPTVSPYLRLLQRRRDASTGYTVLAKNSALLQEMFDVEKSFVSQRAYDPICSLDRDYYFSQSGTITGQAPAEDYHWLRATSFRASGYGPSGWYVVRPDGSMVPRAGTDAPFVYPSAEVWRELRRRQTRYQATDLESSYPTYSQEYGTPIEQYFTTLSDEASYGKIVGQLQEPTEMDFEETPLSDVIDYLKDLHGIPIALDDKSLDEIGIAGDTPVSINVKGIPLRTALQLLLKQIDPTMTYSVQDETLLITTQDAARERLTTRVYPVADLVMPFMERYASLIPGRYGPHTTARDPGRINLNTSDLSVLAAPGSNEPDLTVTADELQTGRLMTGVAINSDPGLVGNVVIDRRPSGSLFAPFPGVAGPSGGDAEFSGSPDPEFDPMLLPRGEMSSELSSGDAGEGLDAVENSLNDALTDLLSYAPGMRTSPLDVQAVLEAEADPGVPSPGHVDPRAAALVARARAAGWQSVEWGPEKARYTIRFDGSGRFRYDRKTIDGLSETVVCDGRSLWHIYPELGVAARRNMGRAYRAAIARRFPWIVLPVEDLAPAADVELLGDRTVALTPRDAAGRKDKAGRPLGYLQVRLVFDANGQLTERQAVDMPSGKIVVRVVNGDDHSVAVFDGQGHEQFRWKFQLAAAAAPDLAPPLEGLVVVPLPLRTEAEVLAKKNLNPEDDPEIWDKESALAVGAAADRPAEAWWAIRRRFLDNHDFRPGLFTLLLRQGFDDVSAASGKRRGNDGPPSLNTARDDKNTAADGGKNAWKSYREIASELLRANPDSPLARYIARQFDRTNAANVPAAAENSNEGFFAELERCRALCALLTRIDRVGPEDRKQQQDSLRRLAADFIRSAHSPRLALLVGNLAVPSLGGSEVHAAMAAVWRRLEQRPDVALTARYARAHHLVHAGQWAAAADEFDAYYRGVLAAGNLPRIDRELFTVLSAAHDPSSQTGQSSHPEAGKADNQVDKWTKLVGDAATVLRDRGGPAAVFALAWQCRNVGDPQRADSLVTEMLSPEQDKHQDDPLAQLLAVAYYGRTQRPERADAILTAVLADKELAQQPLLWLWGAELAANEHRLAQAAARHQHAIDLVFRNPPKRIDLEAVRGDFTALLARYAEVAKAVAVPGRAPPADLIDDIMAAADQWRSLDDDPSGPCQQAAAILRSLGANDAAWDYLTTPLAGRATESGPWIALADQLSFAGEGDMADRAYRTAAECEPNNPRILLLQAQSLRGRGRTAEAHLLYQRIVDGSWLDNYRPVQAEAAHDLEALKTDATGSHPPEPSRLSPNPHANRTRPNQ